MKTKTAASQPPTPVADRDHIQGPPGAPFALVEYGDYQCPYCGEAHPIVRAIVKRMGKQLCFAFRNFPLVDMHAHAEHAAEAAEAADAQGHFWEMHDILFENQNALEDEDIAGYAKELGLDAKRLMDDVRNEAHLERVKEDFCGGAGNGVNGTPTFFVNGARYDGELDAAALFIAITGRET